jgi:hypothetical protein
MILYLILWVLLWFRPYYGFVLVAAICMLALDGVMILVFGALPATMAGYEPMRDPATWLSIPIDYLMAVWPSLLLFVGVGVAIVTLRKWMKARRSPSDSKLDVEMERIRAEIAARDGQPRRPNRC